MLESIKEADSARQEGYSFKIGDRQEGNCWIKTKRKRIWKPHGSLGKDYAI